MVKRIAFRVRDSQDAIDTPWGAQLLAQEVAIAKSESDALRARWESGRLLLEKREGNKRLADRLMNLLTTKLGTSKRELQYRMKFAERFATDTELRNAVAQFKSWHRIVHEGLIDKTRGTTRPRQPSIRGQLRALTTALATLDIRSLTRADLDLFDKLHAEIKRIDQAIDEREQQSA